MTASARHAAVTPPREPRPAPRSRLFTVSRAVAIGIRTAVLRLFEGSLSALARLSPRLVAYIDASMIEARQASMRARYGGRHGIVVPAGEHSFKLVLPKGDRLAHYHYAEHARRIGGYEPIASAILARILNSMDHPRFMDLGAWMGFFTCYARALCRTRCDVWAVESNPAFVDVIRRSLSLNGFGDTPVFQAVLSDRLEKARIDDTCVTPAGDDDDGVVIQTLTLDELCEREGIRPNVLKVDVHGAEGVVLRGGRRLLAESVEFALIEIHPPALVARHSHGMTPSEVIDEALNAGLHLFHVAGHRYDQAEATIDGLVASRFAYRPLTRDTVPLLLHDRLLDILVVASRSGDLEPLLGPPAEDAWEPPGTHESAPRSR